MLNQACDNMHQQAFDQQTPHQSRAQSYLPMNHLKIHTLLKKKKYIEIEEVKKEINNTLYHSFIDQRVKTNQKIRKL